MVRISDRFGRKNLKLLAAAALLAAGGGVGAGAMYAARPVAVMGPVVPVPIGSLAKADGAAAGDTVTSVRGTVAAVYGSRFIVRDASGTALVETGPRGDSLVATGQAVTVQGRFDDGVLHAAFLVGADGKVTALAPRHPPHDGDRPGRHGGPDGRPGDGPGHGPDHGRPRGPDDADAADGGPAAPPPAPRPDAPVAGRS